jgi:hypothetical protein
MSHSSILYHPALLQCPIGQCTSSPSSSYASSSSNSPYTPLHSTHKDICSYIHVGSDNHVTIFIGWMAWTTRVCVSWNLILGPQYRSPTIYSHCFTSVCSYEMQN